MVFLVPALVVHTGRERHPLSGALSRLASPALSLLAAASRVPRAVTRITPGYRPQAEPTIAVGGRQWYLVAFTGEWVLPCGQVSGAPAALRQREPAMRA